MNHFVLGFGEVGQAIEKVLSQNATNVISWSDVEKGVYSQSHTSEVLHVCIPYSPKFVATVNKVKKERKAKLVVVHSTVPVGTCDKNGWIHSPVRGVHPHLARGIQTFVKFFGGKNAFKAARIFNNLGIKTHICTKAATTEAAKIWDTTQYGILIALNKLIYKYCKENELDFNVVYTLFNKTYNEGYITLGRKEVVRPYLKYVEGPIGGHCVINNLRFLKGNPATKFIKKGE